MSHVVVGIVNNAMDKTFLMGLAKFTDALSNPQQEFQSWSREMGASLVPQRDDIGSSATSKIRICAKRTHCSKRSRTTRRGYHD